MKKIIEGNISRWTIDEMKKLEERYECDRETLSLLGQYLWQAKAKDSDQKKVKITIEIED